MYYGPSYNFSPGMYPMQYVAPRQTDWFSIVLVVFLLLIIVGLVGLWSPKGSFF